jgi:denticleless
MKRDMNAVILSAIPRTQLTSSKKFSDMLDSPEALRFEIFSDTTNIRESPHFHTCQLPTPATPLDDGKPKRRISQPDETPTKKPRLLVAESSNVKIDVDIEMDDVVVKRRGCRRTVFRTLSLACNGYPAEPRRMLCMSNSHFLRIYLSNLCSAISQHSSVICVLTYIRCFQMSFKNS